MAEKRKIGSIFVDMVLGTATFDKEVSDFQKKFKRFGKDIGNVGRDLSLAFTAPLTLLGAMSIKASASFETAFAGVKKTVSATDAQFELLRQGLMKMSTELPQSIEQLTKFEQIGGQLNLKPEQLEGFAKTMAQVAMSFDDIDPDEAATKMGQLATAIDMPVEQFSNLASAIAMTADTTASSEGPILDMAQRMAGIGKSANISAAEIVGMSAALSSVGIEAEMGGSAIQRLVMKMQRAAETGTDVKAWSYVMGQSVQEFSKGFREDAAGSVATFIERLQQFKKEGVALPAVLDGLNISESRLVQTLLLGAGAGDQFRNTLNASKKAFEDNSRLAQETARRLETWDSKITLLGNTWKNFTRQIGDDLKDFLLPFVSTLTSIGDAMSKMEPQTRKSAIAFAAVFAAVGPLAISLAGIMTLIGGALLGSVITLTVAVAAMTATWVEFGIYVPQGIENVSKGWEQFKNNFTANTNAIKQGVMDFSVAVVENFEEMMRLVGEIITRGFNAVIDSVKRGTEKVSSFFHEMYMSVVGNSDVPDMMDGVETEFNKLDSSMVGVANAATQKVMDAFKSMAASSAKDTKKFTAEISKAVEQIGELAKIDTPIRKVSARIQEILGSGKQGRELATALQAVQKEYAGSAEKMKIFNKGLEDGTEKFTKLQDELTQLGKGIADVTNSKRFPELENQIKDAFSNQAVVGVDRFNDKISELGTAFVKAGGTAEEFLAILRKLKEQAADPSFFDKLSKVLSGDFNQTIGDIEKFSKQLGDSVESALAGAISSALKTGDFKAAFVDLGADLGATLGESVGGPIGGAIGEVIGDKVANELTEIGKSTKDTIEGLALLGGPMTAPLFFAGGLFGDSKDKDTQARDSIEKFIEDKLQKNVDFSGSNVTEPGWADEWWKTMEASSIKAFTALGTGLAEILGVTEDVGAQIGYVLSTNLNGNLDEARNLMDQLGISSQRLEDAIIKQGIAAGKSWHEIEVMLQGVSELAGEGLHAVGDLEGAFGRLIVSGGKGADAITNLKNLAIEAMESGAKTLQELEATLRSSGKFTDAEITALMESLGQRGITSLEELKDASIRILGGVVADMITKLGENFGLTIDEVNKLISTIESIPKSVTITQTTIEKESKNNGASDTPEGSAKGNAFAFARGGIVSNKTKFMFAERSKVGVMGEAGPEAIMPLTRVGGKLGVNASGMGGSVSQDLYITVNAPNAAPGMEQVIHGVMEQMVDRATAKTLRVIYESARR
jgi:TP901 family phage tail tape measure protein